MGGEVRIGAKRCSGNSNAPCTVSRIGGSTWQNSRVGKLRPGPLDGHPQEATRIRGRNRSQFCERAAADSRDEFLEVREGCRESLGVLGSCFEDGLTVDRRVHQSSHLSGGNAEFPGSVTTWGGDTDLLTGNKMPIATHSQMNFSASSSTTLGTIRAMKEDSDEK